MSRNLVKEELVDYIVEPNFQVSSLQQGEHRVQLESSPHNLMVIFDSESW